MIDETPHYGSIDTSDNGTITICIDKRPVFTGNRIEALGLLMTSREWWRLYRQERASADSDVSSIAQ